MTIKDHTDKQLDELINILKNSLSIELRVPTSDAASTIQDMDKYGLQYKNSWTSMELPDHTVIEFWKKELIKKTVPEE